MRPATLTLRLGDQMRWNGHVAGLADEAAASLLNDLTLGSGRISFAVRLLSANAETQAVLDSVAGAYRALRRARAVLAGEAAHPALADEPHPLPHTAPSMPWQDFLGLLDRAEGEWVLMLLQEAVQHTRHAGLQVLDDAELEPIGLHVVGAVAALAQARRLIADVVPA